MNIHFPQAESGYGLSFFNPATRQGQTSAVFMDLKCAFQILYRTILSLGHSINEGSWAESDIIFHWSQKGIEEYKTSAKIFVIEHGWVPRWSYQISDKGTNSQGHYAGYRFERLNEREKSFVRNYAKKLRDSYTLTINDAHVQEIKKKIKEPFILFPFQLASDANLRYSKTAFSKFFSRTQNNNVAFAQACIDRVARCKLPLKIVFKQHPVDKNAAIDRILRNQRDNIVLTNNDAVSTHELFATGLCKLVIGINSNTLHEALIWNVPVVSLAAMIWDDRGRNRPLPKDIARAEEIIRRVPWDDDVTLG
jgi:hypothetical protein